MLILNFRNVFQLVKRYVCDVRNLRLRYYLPISVNDRAISPLREDYILTKLRICGVTQK